MNIFKHKLKKPSPIFLILLCFLMSGMIRIWDTGAAIAEEIAATSEEQEAATHQMSDAASCPPQLDSEELLKAIRERQAQLDIAEERINTREQLLRVSKIKIDEQLGSLERAEEQLAATLALADQAAENDVQRLTAVYENMKPKEAAEIFETMDINFAAGFLMRMRPDAAAGIMTNLNSEAAYSISVVMAGRNVGAPTE